MLFQSGSSGAETSVVASEAAIASNLTHDNIVSTYSHDICRVQDPNLHAELEIYKFYLIQEFCNGGSLADALAAGMFASTRMSTRWRLIVHVLMGIARGMGHMHSKRITHGDLNPANVLFKVRAAAPLTPLIA